MLRRLSVQAPAWLISQPTAAALLGKLSDAKNPYGYCGLGGTGVPCPVGVVRADG